MKKFYFFAALLVGAVLTSCTSEDDLALSPPETVAEDVNVPIVFSSLKNNKGEDNEYGNLYLTDGENRLYVYGCYPGYGATGDFRKDFLAAAGIEVGDKLTMIGYKDTYNGTIELCGGIYFSHEK